MIFNSKQDAWYEDNVLRVSKNGKYGLIEINNTCGESAIGAVRVHYKKGEHDGHFIGKLYLKSRNPYIPVDEDPNVYVGSFEIIEEEEA